MMHQEYLSPWSWPTVILSTSKRGYFVRPNSSGIGKAKTVDAPQTDFVPVSKILRKDKENTHYFTKTLKNHNGWCLLSCSSVSCKITLVSKRQQSSNNARGCISTSLHQRSCHFKITQENYAQPGLSALNVSNLCLEL